MACVDDTDRREKTSFPETASGRINQAGSCISACLSGSLKHPPATMDGRLAAIDEAVSPGPLEDIHLSTEASESGPRDRKGPLAPPHGGGNRAEVGFAIVVQSLARSH
jgi:hypothetical protein